MESAGARLKRPYLERRMSKAIGATQQRAAAAGGAEGILFPQCTRGAATAERGRWADDSMRWGEGA
jgi:hypothetical protein